MSVKGTVVNKDVLSGHIASPNLIDEIRGRVAKLSFAQNYQRPIILLPTEDALSVVNIRTNRKHKGLPTTVPVSLSSRQKFDSYFRKSDWKAEQLPSYEDFVPKNESRSSSSLTTSQLKEPEDDNVMKFTGTSLSILTTIYQQWSQDLKQIERLLADFTAGIDYPSDLYCRSSMIKKSATQTYGLVPLIKSEESKKLTKTTSMASVSSESSEEIRRMQKHMLETIEATAQTVRELEEKFRPLNKIDIFLSDMDVRRADWKHFRAIVQRFAHLIKAKYVSMNDGKFSETIRAKFESVFEKLMTDRITDMRQKEHFRTKQLETFYPELMESVRQHIREQKASPKELDFPKRLTVIGKCNEHMRQTQLDSSSGIPSKQLHLKQMGKKRFQEISRVQSSTETGTTSGIPTTKDLHKYAANRMKEIWNFKYHKIYRIEHTSASSISDAKEFIEEQG